jgi:bacteriocin-like protein
MKTITTSALASVTGGQAAQPPVTPRPDFEVLSSNGLARAIYKNGAYVRTESVR